MKIILMAVVMSMMAGGAYAAGFSDLAVKVPGLKGLEQLAGNRAEIVIPDPKAEKSIENPAVAGQQKTANAGDIKGITKIYTNDKGCIVEVEERLNGFMYYVQNSDRQQVWVGVLKNYKSGDISAFANDATVSGTPDRLVVEGGNSEHGAYTTRGRAELDFTKGKLSAVRVTGEVKRLLGWKVDTKINCENLK